MIPGKEYSPILTDVSEGKGGEANAFRHALWQATIANRYGIQDAESAGNVHEDDPIPDLMERRFAVERDQNGKVAVPEKVDTVVDQLNNPIGRFIGSQTAKESSMRDLAEKVLEYYRDHGLWVVVIDGDVFKVRKVRLEDGKYRRMKSALQKKDPDGEWLAR